MNNKEIWSPSQVAEYFKEKHDSGEVLVLPGEAFCTDDFSWNDVLKVEDEFFEMPEIDILKNLYAVTSVLQIYKTLHSWPVELKEGWRTPGKQEVLLSAYNKWVDEGMPNPQISQPSEDSLHLRGLALDFSVSDAENPADVIKLIKKSFAGELGLEENHIHMGLSTFADENIDNKNSEQSKDDKDSQSMESISDGVNPLQESDFLDYINNSQNADSFDTEVSPGYNFMSDTDSGFDIANSENPVSEPAFDYANPAAESENRENPITSYSDDNFISENSELNPDIFETEKSVQSEGDIEPNNSNYSDYRVLEEDFSRLDNDTAEYDGDEDSKYITSENKSEYNENAFTAPNLLHINSDGSGKFLEIPEFSSNLEDKNAWYNEQVLSGMQDSKTMPNNSSANNVSVNIGLKSCGNRDFSNVIDGVMADILEDFCLMKGYDMEDSVNEKNESFSE